MVTVSEATPGGACLCGSKAWPTGSAGYLLFGYGGNTEVVKDLCNLAAEKAQAAAEQALERLSSRNAKLDACDPVDILAVSVQIEDALRPVNKTLLETLELLGVGTYVGGVLFYATGKSIMLLPFGGGCAYIVKGGELRQLAAPDDMIPDALGGAEIWSPVIVSERLNVGEHLLLLSEKAPRMTIESIGPMDSGKKRNVMLLRRELEQASGQPQAAMEIWL